MLIRLSFIFTIALWVLDIWPAKAQIRLFPQLTQPHYGALMQGDTLWFTVYNGAYESLYFSIYDDLLGRFTNPQAGRMGATAGKIGNKVCFYDGRYRGTVLPKEPNLPGFLQGVSSVTRYRQTNYAVYNNKLHQINSQGIRPVRDFNTDISLSAIHASGSLLVLTGKQNTDKWQLLLCDSGLLGWTPPEPLPLSVNQPNTNTRDYCLLPNGNYVFASDREQNTYALYLMEDSLKLISFIFAFTDSTYENALSVSTEEAELLGIDSQSVIDGVLLAKVKDEILEKVRNSAINLPQSRINYIHHQLDTTFINPDIGDVVQFGWAFSDSTLMVNNIELTPAEVIVFGINVHDTENGVLTEAAKERIYNQLTETDNSVIEQERLDVLLPSLQPDLFIQEFIFAFTDSSYSKGVTFTQEEAEILDISEDNVFDGVLSLQKQEEIAQMLDRQAEIEPMRSIYIRENLNLKNNLTMPGDPVSFVFAFVDTSYQQGITFTPGEAAALNLTATNVVDGVLPAIIQEKIYQILIHNLPDSISTQRADYILSRLQNTSSSLVHQANVSGNLLLVQIGAYKQRFDNFSAYLLNRKYISQDEYSYLSQFEIRVAYINELYKYRIVIPKKELKKLDNIFDFDRPFRIKD